MTPTFFPDQYQFRDWLQANHQSETELNVGYYKVGSGKPSMSWSESVDQALCFGWIDGVRKSVDEERYMIRFSPRKKSSIWSAVNIKKVEELKAKGLMHPAGLAIYAHRKEDKSGVYSHENKNPSFSKELEEQFRASAKAWTFYETTPPSYKRSTIHWVMSAKREETTLKRLEQLIADSEKGERVRQFAPRKKG